LIVTNRARETVGSATGSLAGTAKEPGHGEKIAGLSSVSAARQVPATDSPATPMAMAVISSLNLAKSTRPLLTRPSHTALVTSLLLYSLGKTAATVAYARLNRARARRNADRLTEREKVYLDRRRLHCTSNR
jgi:hypothetical protein